MNFKIWLEKQENNASRPVLFGAFNDYGPRNFAQPTGNFFDKAAFLTLTGIGSDLRRGLERRGFQPATPGSLYGHLPKMHEVDGGLQAQAQMQSENTQEDVEYLKNQIEEKYGNSINEYGLNRALAKTKVFYEGGILTVIMWFPKGEYQYRTGFRNSQQVSPQGQQPGQQGVV